MENSVYKHHHLRRLVTFPSSSSSSPSSQLSSLSKPHLRFFSILPRKLVGSPCLCLKGRPMKVKASAGRRHCEFSSLNSPLEPRSMVGKFLSGVLQNHPQLFHNVTMEELRLLSDDRDSAVARMLLSQGSDEALLHRRIAQVRENECKIAIEDVMYLLILYKFSEIRVPLVPKLSSCVYNGRLEILPSKDWELESIHSLEILDIIKEHVRTVTGLKANSSVNDSWATTKIRKIWLARVYVASILYGYFLKSVSLRYHLERSLSLSNRDLHVGHKTGLSFRDSCPYGSKDVIFDNKEEIDDLKCYVMGFHPGSLQKCAKLRSEEAVHLVESHSHALFGNEGSGLFEHDDVILTSFSSLRRLVLEAVAFGSFLWETEDYIDNVYKLKYHEVV
ncbi:UV-B-induced protein At3g17800, chloroplastic-like isoform X2 [Gastrolobium bilobum]|uniref:UV-B-induced protein At3g17800, chloroplastic-like isoform X2 n=1 Tax=Gastrolobium bilobum TaxID=150636 RepID=UPI002AB04D9E|nr:UV-B-induced protein At3g17800, chloroplastic-like isoform X2 [Gastrolobium bilobum]